LRWGEIRLEAEYWLFGIATHLQLWRSCDIVRLDSNVYF
jgi:hypothetical protein